MRPKSIIVCAACKQGEHVVLGARHWDIRMRQAASNIACKWTGCEQGFIDQFGNFLTREQAMIVVKENGQPFNMKRNGGDGTKLFSEGLY